MAVEGLWNGTMEEGRRRRNGHSRSASSRGTADSTGTLSTRAGKVELNTPLRDVAFQKNEVRFTADISGSPRTFTGRCRAEPITGTIAKGTGQGGGPLLPQVR